MKLERALAFFQSKKMGVEPGSKSFDLSDADRNSAGYKLQNKKVKHASLTLTKNEWALDPSSYDRKSADCMAEPKLEFYNSAIDFNNDHVTHVVDFVAPNSHSSKNKRGLDPPLHELESAANKTMPKLEFYDSMLDLKNQYEAHVNAMALIEPVSDSSKDMEAFMKFPNDKQSVKKSATSPIGTFQNSLDVYLDKTEYEPEMEVYYQGNTYHLVKEICVDDQVVIKPKLVFEDSVDDNAYNCVPSLVFGSKEIPKNNGGNKGFNLSATVEPEKVSANHDLQNAVIYKDKDVNENRIGSTGKEMNLPKDTHDSIPFGDTAEQFSSEAELHSKSKGSKKMLEEAALARPALGLGIDESNSDGTRSLSYHFEPSALADCGKKECRHLGVCNCDVTHHTVKPLEGHYIRGEASQIHNSLGEASFSALGHVSGRISYSGSIPYSGSISIRSDSSTTSTRSFAFPILQSEYISSPVRMAKPEKKSRFWKQSSWRNSLLCCKF